jgi:hypothetical protein
MEKSIVNEVVRTLEAVTGYGQPGFWILLASILIVLVLVMAAVVYRRFVIKRSQARSQATQENFEAIAADLRKRALEVKKQDESQRKRELEVKERKQQQVLKRSQRALKGSVIIVLSAIAKDYSIGGPIVSPVRLNSQFIERKSTKIFPHGSGGLF